MKQFDMREWKTKILKAPLAGLISAFFNSSVTNSSGTPPNPHTATFSPSFSKISQ